MEKRKHLFLKCVLKQKPEITLKDYLKEISSTEPEARSFYSDIEMGSEKFEQMLLLDSLFVLLLFCGMPESLERMILTSNRIGSEVEGMSENVNQIKEDIGIEEPMFINYSENKSRSFWSLFAHDLFTLENQIPFFVLQKIHNLAHGGPETQLMVTMKNAFSKMLSDYMKLDLEMVNSQTEEVDHLLHLCHQFFCTALQETSTNQLPESCQMFLLANAAPLDEAGVANAAPLDNLVLLNRVF